MSLIEKFENAVRLQFGEQSELIILQYLREKCLQKPEYFTKITNSLYLGLNDIYENERKERVEIEYASLVYMVATNDKGLKKVKHMVETLVERLKLFKYVKVDSEKERVNRILEEKWNLYLF